MLRLKWARATALFVLIAMLAVACAQQETPQVTDGETDQETEAARQEAPESLTVGYILPETGPLAFLGPPQIAAVKLAIEDINAAGGVLGSDVEGPVAGDEAGDEAVANQSADRLLSEGVSVIIGAAASGMSLAIIDKVTGAEVVQCSGSNTAPTFTEYDDGGFYFRTAPTDALQGPVLAQTMIDDGHANIVLMARADDYGRGLADATEEAITGSGGTVAEKIIYDPNATNFDADVQRALAANPDAVAVIGFDEGAQVISGLLEGGLQPDQLYGADGVRSEDLPNLVGGANALDGMKGTAPAPESDPGFIQRLKESSPDLQDTTFAAQVYDCVMLTALAAIAADSTDPADFAPEIVNVSREGTACTSFEECAALLDEGEDIDYNGASGPVDMIEAGEPERGIYEIWAFENGELTQVDTVESSLE